MIGSVSRGGEGCEGEIPPPPPPFPQMEAVTHKGQSEWEVEGVLPSVSFAPLILPSSEIEGNLTTFEIHECCSFPLLHPLTSSVVTLSYIDSHKPTSTLSP